jgi:hypothetical protein
MEELFSFNISMNLNLFHALVTPLSFKYKQESTFHIHWMINEFGLNYRPDS